VLSIPEVIIQSLRSTEFKYNPKIRVCAMPASVGRLNETASLSVRAMFPVGSVFMIGFEFAYRYL